MRRTKFSQDLEIQTYHPIPVERIIFALIFKVKKKLVSLTVPPNYTVKMKKKKKLKD